jgi:hypothetical protein
MASTSPSSSSMLTWSSVAPGRRSPMAVTRPLRMRITAAQGPGLGVAVLGGRPQHVGADGVAGLDVGDPLDLHLGAGQLLEQGELVGAGGRPGPGHPGDGAVVLADHEVAVAGAGAVGHVAVLVLDGGQGAGQLGQGSALVRLAYSSASSCWRWSNSRSTASGPRAEVAASSSWPTSWW